LTQHNGQHGCIYCEEPGIIVASGAGSYRSYVRIEGLPTQRTDHSIRENAIQVHHTGKTHIGFKCPSVQTMEKLQLKWISSCFTKIVNA